MFLRALKRKQNLLPFYFLTKCAKMRKWIQLFECWALRKAEQSPPQVPDWMTWKRNFANMIIFSLFFEDEITLYYLGGPTAIKGSLWTEAGGSSSEGRQCDDKSRGFQGYGTMSQAMREASRSWKRPGLDSPLELLGRSSPANWCYLDLWSSELYANELGLLWASKCGDFLQRQ